MGVVRLALASASPASARPLELIAWKIWPEVGVQIAGERAQLCEMFRDRVRIVFRQFLPFAQQCMRIRIQLFRRWDTHVKGEIG